MDDPVADSRDLERVAADFDVVRSYGNALPYLLENAEIERPAVAPLRLVAGPPRRLVARLHDWDEPGGSLHTVHLVVLTEPDGGWTPVLSACA